MELESLGHQPGGLIGTVEDFSLSRLLGTFYSFERFREIDFSSPASVYHNPSDSLGFTRKSSKDFFIDPSPLDKVDFEADTSLKKLNAMEAKFNGNAFAGAEDFKIALDFSRKIENGSRVPAIGSLCESFGSLKASDRKRKVWELNELSKEFETQESEREKRKIRKTSESEFEIVWNNSNQENGSSKMPPWHVDVIENIDLDSSLSNLGADLATGSYNMSEALLSLPSLTVFKQEARSPSQDNLISPTNQQQNIEEVQDHASTFHRLLQQNNFPNVSKRTNLSCQTKIVETGNEKNNEDCRFQYVLAAATSIATKVTEETLTYLNQGQSYEIKLKKVGELSNFRGKILKEKGASIQVLATLECCHFTKEASFEYVFMRRGFNTWKKEQILAWQASRPGERIVELDVPLSYGLFDVEQDPKMLNTLSFLWDPTTEVGAYIKVNCISTEFTPKKHGGEKGVPFRIQVETFIEGETTRLHAAACQIKVFKLKGADRKHKQDREKILKRPLSEQDMYQPSYECTVLGDLLPDAVFSASAPSSTSTTPHRNKGIYLGDTSDSCLISHVRHRSPSNTPPEKGENHAISERVDGKCRTPLSLPSQSAVNLQISQLSPEFSCLETAQWLRKNSFGNYVSTFANFSGADILRLTRDDLIQICGLADGIRLLYALHLKAIVRITLYVCTPSSTIYHAVYLNDGGRNDLTRKLAALIGIHENQIHDLFLQGPQEIRVLITDEVVSNLKDESMFSVEVLKDETRSRFILLLKPQPQSS